MQNALMKSIGEVRKRRPVQLRPSLHTIKNVLVIAPDRINHELNNKLRVFAKKHHFSQSDAVNYILSIHFANDH